MSRLLTVHLNVRREPNKSANRNAIRLGKSCERWHVDAPALLFDRLSGDQFGMQVLSNMLGASKERYALAVGLDPALSTRDKIAATRTIMRHRIAPVYVDKLSAPVNEIILRGEQIDLTRFPTPKFWPGDGGRYIGTGDVTFTRDPA